MDFNDESMKTLLKDLGVALHQALTRDETVKALTDKIKVNGYDIYLIMEANIALDKKKNDTEGQLYLRSHAQETSADFFKLNDYDTEFLASMKIAADED